LSLSRVIPEEGAEDEVTEIPVEAVVPGPGRKWSSFDDRRFAALVSAAKRTGTVDPVVVRPAGNVFELVLGERRLAAARLAGLRRVPAVVRELSPRDMALMSLLEDLETGEFDVIEEAEGYRRLGEEFGLTQAEIGRAVGKSQSTIANKLRLLRLPESVRRRVSAEGVSERHARALLDLPDEGLQHKVLDEVKACSLSVRETEERIRALLGTAPAEKGTRGSGRAGGTTGEETAPSAGGRPVTWRGLGQVSDRRAIRAFRDIRLFLNTFRRAVEMLKEAGIAAEMTEAEAGDCLEIRVRIPTAGGCSGVSVRAGGARKVPPEGGG
jgi:ParB family chromosome partitioning protein